MPGTTASSVRSMTASRLCLGGRAQRHLSRRSAGSGPLGLPAYGLLGPKILRRYSCSSIGSL
jgi:hypothetical protein